MTSVFSGIYMVRKGLYHCKLTKDHSRSAQLKKNVCDFSFESPTVFLLTSFSYNYPSRSFLCMSNFNPLLHY